MAVKAEVGALAGWVGVSEQGKIAGVRVNRCRFGAVNGAVLFMAVGTVAAGVVIPTGVVG